MIIFAMDTSAAAASCALLEDDRPIAQFYTDAHLTHSQTIMPMVESLLSCSHMTIQQVDLFAASVGPGSFTGLRIGVAAVKGMAQVLDKPCAAVSALEGLAYNLSDRTGIICPALDARCGQVYTAWFDADRQMQRMHEDCALMADQLCEQLIPLSQQAPITLVGDGAQLVKDTMQTIDPQLAGRLLLPGKHLLLQHAYGIGLAAWRQVTQQKLPLISAQQLVPVYLKLPQAQRELQLKLKKQQ